MEWREKLRIALQLLIHHVVAISKCQTLFASVGTFGRNGIVFKINLLIFFNSLTVLTNKYILAIRSLFIKC